MSIFEQLLWLWLLSFNWCCYKWVTQDENICCASLQYLRIKKIKNNEVSYFVHLFRLSFLHTSLTHHTHIIVHLMKTSHTYKIHNTSSYNSELVGWRFHHWPPLQWGTLTTAATDILFDYLTLENIRFQLHLYIISLILLPFITFTQSTQELKSWWVLFVEVEGCLANTKCLAIPSILTNLSYFKLLYITHTSHHFHTFVMRLHNHIH